MGMFDFLFKKNKKEAKVLSKSVKETRVNQEKLRQEKLGITEYTWSSSGDERTCEYCRENEGKVFKWSTPPEKTGHPGEGKCCTDRAGCRCSAIAVIKW